MVVFGIIFGVIVIGAILGVRELVKDKHFWDRQNYMSKINKKF